MLLLRTLGSVALLERTPAGEQHLDVQQKRLGLLVFLVRRGRGAFVRRDVLLSLFWPEADEQHGRGALRQGLSAFRKQLGPDALITHGEEEVGLAPHLVTSDATEFEEACRAGSHETACALYQGDFLAGFHATGVSPEFEQWVDAERDRLRRLARDAAWSMSRRSEEAGNADEALRWARHAVDLEPSDEAGVARLIALLDRQGDRAGALAMYAALERRLMDEYSAEPAPETRALMQSLRRRPTPVGMAELAGRGGPPAVPIEPGGSGVSLGVPVAAAEPRPRRRLLIAGAIGALATVVLATLLGPTRPTPAIAARQSGVLAVVPFRIHSSDNELAWLHEGMVELLTMRLMGSEGLSVVEPGRVLAAWHSAPPGNEGSATAEALQRLADAVDAVRVVRGSVSGTPAHLVLAAWVIGMPDGRIEAQASVEGPADSLPFLVDRLGAQLLGLTAGVESHRLASLAGTSLPAIRSFLAGRSAFRRGRPEEAVLQFRVALTIDSTFALAALDLWRAAGWTNDDNGAPGGRLARKYSSRLSAADRALLDALQSQWWNAPGMFARWDAAVAAYPERPETWYGLGDSYFHWGTLAGIANALPRAEDAFRRGWVLDSAANGDAALGGPLVVEPMSHMVELAHLRADTAEVLRLTGLVLAADPSSDLAFEMRWHRAAVQDRAARDALWALPDSGAPSALRAIVGFVVWTGVAAEEYARPDLWERRRRETNPFFLSNGLSAIALNGGRPRDVPRSRAFQDYAPREDLRRRLKESMFWGGDSTAASEAARRLSRFADAPPVTGAGARPQYQDICALGLWRIAHGDAVAAAAARDRLRATSIPGLTGLDSVSFVQYRQFCPALLDASRAVALGDGDALERVATADSLARTYIFEVCCGEAVIEANLILARLWEELGDRDNALRAVRRRGAGFLLEPLFVSAFLHEEGRLAALTGDTTGAIRAYRHYLALRTDPEPIAQAEVQQVRRDLAALSPRTEMARAP